MVAWAKASGLKVTHLYQNRLVVDLSGSVANVQKAVGVQINTYRLGSKTFFANNANPVLPASLSGIVESIDGLSSLQTMFPASPGYEEPASPMYSAGPVVSNGASAHANGSLAKLRAAMRASRTKPNITDGAYDPTDIYSSEGVRLQRALQPGPLLQPTRKQRRLSGTDVDRHRNLRLAGLQ